MPLRWSVLLGLLLIVVSGLTATAAERVTVDNFVRAETDNYFAKFENEGAFGKFKFDRNLAPIDQQTVIRLNRDTLYAFGVFDLDAGPLTFTLPDAGKRYMAVQVINQDHYATDVIYQPGRHTLTKEQVGTRYVCLANRTFVNPNDPADVKIVHALQDGLRAEQKSAGKLELPEWDQKSLTAVRQALLGVVAANGGVNSAHMFGRKDEVDPVQHLLGTAAGWGGNPQTAAYYVGAEPKENDGKTAYRLTVKDVPVDGFWSISIYNKDGFFVKNERNAYTLNNVTAQPNADGSFTVQFGGKEGEAPNVLPIMPGWNYLVRMYRPRKEVLDGSWKFPEATPISGQK